MSPEQATNLGEVYGLRGINAGHSITAGHTESHGPPARGRGLRDPSPRRLVLRAPEGSQDEQKWGEGTLRCRWTRIGRGRTGRVTNVTSKAPPSLRDARTADLPYLWCRHAPRSADTKTAKANEPQPRGPRPQCRPHLARGLTPVPASPGDQAAQCPLHLSPCRSPM